MHCPSGLYIDILLAVPLPSNWVNAGWVFFFSPGFFFCRYMKRKKVARINYFIAIVRSFLFCQAFFFPKRKKRRFCKNLGKKSLKIAVEIPKNAKDWAFFDLFFRNFISKNMKFSFLTFENFFKVLTIVNSCRPALPIRCNDTLFHIAKYDGWQGGQ